VLLKLQLPEGMKLHNIFHANMLNRCIAGTGKVRPLPQALFYGHLEYEAERVIYHDPKQRLYVVKWAGHGHEYYIWEPEI
jgi:hypothetical protein